MILAWFGDSFVGKFLRVMEVWFEDFASFTLQWIVNVNLNAGPSILYCKEHEGEEVAHVLRLPMLLPCVYSREDMDGFFAGSEGDVAVGWLSLHVWVFEGRQAEHSVARVKPSELCSELFLNGGGVVSPKLLLLLFYVLSEVELRSEQELGPCLKAPVERLFQVLVSFHETKVYARSAVHSMEDLRFEAQEIV